MNVCPSASQALRLWRDLPSRRHVALFVGRSAVSVELMRFLYPYGLGMAPEAIDQIIADAKRSAQELAADPEVKPARSEEGGRPRKGEENHVNNTVSRGSTNAETIVRRLKRDAPEIADALGRGEFPSARGDREVDLLTVAPAQQGERSDLDETLHNDCAKSDSRNKRSNLRAILRAPEQVQSLYREGLIRQTDAAKLGPRSPTPEQASLPTLPLSCRLRRCRPIFLRGDLRAVRLLASF
jgi:hypothetical protein